jgi:hypothetical protein
MSSRQGLGDTGMWKMMGIYVPLDFCLFCGRKKMDLLMIGKKPFNHSPLQNFLYVNPRRQPLRYTVDNYFFYPALLRVVCLILMYIS